MNNNKTRHGLWLVVGAYLAYTGFNLAQGVLKDKPDHAGFLIAAGVLFIGVGAVLVIRSIKELRKPADIEEAEEDALEEELDEDE